MTRINISDDAVALIRIRQHVKAVKVIREENQCGLKEAWEAVQAHPAYQLPKQALLTKEQRILGPVVGTLLKNLIGETGLWDSEMTDIRAEHGEVIYPTAETWLKSSSVPANVIRDWLLTICLDEGLDAEALQMTPSQLYGLGFPAGLGAKEEDDD